MLYVRIEEIPRDERHLVPFNQPRPLPPLLQGEAEDSSASATETRSCSRDKEKPESD